MTENAENSGLLKQAGDRKEDDGIDRPHNQVLECTHRKDREESLSVEHVKQ